MNTTTVAQLRPLLADYFGWPETNTALRVLRLAGVIGEGASGFGGCRSAPLDARQAALVLLALASSVQPKDCAAEAERLGAFRLLRRDMTQAGEVPRLAVYENQQINLLDALVCQLVRGVDDDHQPPGWVIGSHEAAQAAPDRLVFGDGEPASEVERQTVIGARLLADIGGLFREPRAEAA
jgi:hypothetical protein